MEKRKGFLRKLLKFEFDSGRSAKEAMDCINEVQGAGAVSKSTAFRWFSKFKKNTTDTHDKKRSGRPREINRHAVVTTLEKHPSISTRQLANDFGCARTAIRKILHAADKKWLKDRWMSKTPAETQKLDRAKKHS